MHHVYRWPTGIPSSRASAVVVSPARSRSTAETLNSRLYARRLRLGIEFSPRELLLVFVSHFWGALHKRSPHPLRAADGGPHRPDACTCAPQVKQRRRPTMTFQKGES